MIVDSKGVVEEVEKYRNDCRPEKTTIVLLAESHAHTSQIEFRQLLREDFLHHDGSRCRYVNYVYCIGNSESWALESEHPIIRRTWQYWRILYSCLHLIRRNEDFHEFEGGSSEDRVKRKLALILDLRRKGIWLLDSSIIGINLLENKTRKKIIRRCWESKLQDLFSELMTDGLRCVITIGATVYQILEPELTTMGLEVVREDQPQRRGSYMSNYRDFFRVCQQYRLPNSVGSNNQS